MKIIIDINDSEAPKIMSSIAAANNWPRDNTPDTVERINLHMMRTVGQWTKSGSEILGREAEEAATMAAIAGAVKISAEI